MSFSYYYFHELCSTRIRLRRAVLPRSVAAVHCSSTHGECQLSAAANATRLWRHPWNSAASSWRLRWMSFFFVGLSRSLNDSHITRSKRPHSSRLTVQRRWCLHAYRCPSAERIHSPGRGPSTHCWCSWWFHRLQWKQLVQSAPCPLGWLSSTGSAICCQGSVCALPAVGALRPSTHATQWPSKIRWMSKSATERQFQVPWSSAGRTIVCAGAPNDVIIISARVPS